MDDLALLRQFEPVIRYDPGEHFLPTGVDGFVSRCSILAQDHLGRRRKLADVGELDLDRLAALGRRYGDEQLSLRFVQHELNRRDARLWRREWMGSGGAGVRFGAVGVVGRLSDALLKGSLLLRGRVPGGHIAAAHSEYLAHLDPTRSPYYGRVVRESGWTVCQYWFFYAANDWRTSFNGVNDHEADWEMVAVYVVEEGGSARPAWVAFSAHDYSGPRVRRRWDDPELLKVGDHPVLFAGAGSHSGAFVAGDYVVTVDAPDLRGFVRVATKVRALITPWAPQRNAIAIPFVDFAHGGGTSVGPGGDREWEPVLIADGVPWVRDYSGLWGLETHDRLGGERAPSGPRYNRDGTVRSSWADPLGWAGMVRVPTGEVEARQLLEERIAEIDRQLVEHERQIRERRQAVRRLGVAVDSLWASTTSRELLASRGQLLTEAEAELTASVELRTRLREERAVHGRVLADPPEPAGPQDHLHGDKPLPYVEPSGRVRVLRVWGLISVPLLLLGLVGLLWQRRFGLLPAVGLVVLLLMTGEAFARDRLLRFLGGILVLVAVVVAALWLLVYWRITLTAVLATLAVLILFTNIREAIRRRAPSRVETSDGPP